MIKPMSNRQHLSGRESCPFLPSAAVALGPDYSRSQRGTEDYYLSTLTCAQSLWLQGKPAQALLQLNHALAVVHLAASPWPLPYQAMLWMFTHRDEESFMGNPVRHFQHLASRMSGPNKEMRSWRAWACFHLAESVLAADEFPRDLRQISKENLQIPSWEQTLEKLTQLTSVEEADFLRGLLRL